LHRYILPIFLLVSGCTTAPYQEPNSGERARVRFATESQGVTVVFKYEDERCSADRENEITRLRAGHLFNSNPKRIGIPMDRFHPNGFNEFYFKANTKLIGVFSGGEDFGTSGYTCKVPFGFEVTQGDFEVVFFASRQGCGASINKIAPAGEGKFNLEPVPPLPIDIDSCKSFKKPRLS
jgi:hypothetical protein